MQSSSLCRSKTFFVHPHRHRPSFSIICLPILPQPPPPPPLHRLHDIIFKEVGGLDDMETRLNDLNIFITPSHLSTILDSATAAITSVLTTRRLLRFFHWSRCNGAEKLPDQTFNKFLRIVSSKSDLTAQRILLSDLRRENRIIDSETFGLVIESLVKCGREVDAVRLFKDLEKKHHIPSSPSTSTSRVTTIIHALCEKGHARKAEGIVFHHKAKLGFQAFPDVYRHLLHGWCTQRNAREARRVLVEMKEAGICPGLGSYNAYLRCICDRNVRFNPSALSPEADLIMMEMRTSGVAPTAVTYNILLSCLGRKRRVKEACEVLDSMIEGRVNCCPDWVTYYLVVRVLFLTERFVRGNRIVEQMIDTGLTPSSRFYHDLIGVLCGMEKMDHALKLFDRMKMSCVGNLGPTYDLLIGKLCRNGKFDTGRNLWDEAIGHGVDLHCSSELLDPSKVEVFNVSSKPTVKPKEVAFENFGRKEKKKGSIATKKRIINNIIRISRD
ncbi:putative Pentatricopeptide repeat-containing protein [Zostera marina]|uniref:Putative Pentatricopeptide repeat-containing protein n=1 Tax=Zostera marina TaxID=29655 RepID=A0A0K9P4I4_ZOSMR|nr:putative Pentatricopeptide repeat-containing protein [Zostera marina]